MNDEPDHRTPVPWPRWLRLDAAAEYVGLKRGTLELKLAAGCGPKAHRSPGSRTFLFWTGDLDDWIRNSPEREPTAGETERYLKLQRAAERSRERRRAERQNKTEEEVV